MDFRELAQTMLKWKEGRNIAPTTMKNYVWALHFIEKAYQKTIDKPIEAVTVEDVRLLLAWIYDQKVSKDLDKEGYPSGFTSYNYIRGVIKQIFKYKLREDIAREIGSTGLEEPEIRPLGIGEIKNILKELSNIHEMEKARIEEHNATIVRGQRAILRTDPDRDRLIIMTLFSTGLRASELIALKTSDIDFDKGFGRIVGKGRIRYADKFYFLFGTHKLIEEYIKDKQIKENGFIFNRSDGKPLDYISLYKAVKTYSDSLYGLRDTDNREIGFRPHTFRHSVAVFLLNNGWTPAKVQQFLRHKNILTTSRYLIDTETALVKEIENIKDGI